MATSKGTDVISKMETGKSDISAEVSASQTAVATPILQRAVVSRIFNDLSLYTVEEFDEIRETLINPNFLDSAPRNTIIARIVTAGQDKRDNKGLLCYPFFPPHLSFPVKAGEQVWLINENPDVPNAVGYWMCRIPEPAFVDDVNYTHGDRKFDAGSQLSTSEKADQEAAAEPAGPAALGDEQESEGEEIDPTPTFINGAGNADGYSLSEEEAYETIVEESESYMSFTAEPVPRFTKRSPDMVIQGSNNTLICLGEDRGWNATETAEGSEQSNATKTEEEMERTFAGTIDIVAGRGRWSPDAAEDDPELTACRFITNAREDDETDKNPLITGIELEVNRQDAPPEGDPDFINDSSRVYVSMNTDGDANFDISSEAGTMAAGFEAEISDVADSPFIVVKSDEVRIIATKNEDKEVNGSIRIVKQGTPDDDLATIVILPDGTIQISGSKIFLGRVSDEGGVGADDGAPGPGDSQPWVKYQQLEELLTDAFDNIKSFANDLATHFNSNATPGYGQPNPSLIAAAASECATLASDMTSRISDIETIKSERIFGE